MITVNGVISKFLEVEKTKVYVFITESDGKTFKIKIYNNVDNFLKNNKIGQQVTVTYNKQSEYEKRFEI